MNAARLLFSYPPKRRKKLILKGAQLRACAPCAFLFRICGVASPLTTAVHMRRFSQSLKVNHAFYVAKNPFSSVDH